jgi:hypothetical protein
MAEFWSERLIRDTLSLFGGENGETGVLAGDSDGTEP